MAQETTKGFLGVPSAACARSKGSWAGNNDKSEARLEHSKSLRRLGAGALQTPVVHRESGEMLGVGSVQDHPTQGSAGVLYRIISTQEHHFSACLPVLASPSSAHYNSNPNSHQGMAEFVFFL